MNKGQLARIISEENDISQASAERMINTAMHAIQQAVVKGEEVNLLGFGTFKPAIRKSRVGHNPKTGERMEIPARRVPVFNPSKSFKAAVEQ